MDIAKLNALTSLPFNIHHTSELVYHLVILISKDETVDPIIEANLLLNMQKWIS